MICLVCDVELETQLCSRSRRVVLRFYHSLPIFFRITKAYCSIEKNSIDFLKLYSYSSASLKIGNKQINVVEICSCLKVVRASKHMIFRKTYVTHSSIFMPIMIYKIDFEIVDKKRGFFDNQKRIYFSAERQELLIVKKVLQDEPPTHT